MLCARLQVGGGFYAYISAALRVHFIGYILSIQAGKKNLKKILEKFWLNPFSCGIDVK